MWSDLRSVLVAAGIGALVGAERERSHRDVPGHFGGIRSFTVLAVAGALAQLISAAVVAAGLVAAGAVIAAGEWRSARHHPGSTTALTALAVYLLGALTGDRPQLAVAVAVVIAVLLVSKERVHSVLSDRVTDEEVADALKFAVIALVVLPLLPDRGMGPYAALNPFRIWLIVVSITGIGWLGYLGTRILGARRGLLVSGFAGGFVSASATTSAMGRVARQDPARARPATVGALVASVATMVQLLLVVSVSSPEVATRLLAPSASVVAVVLLGVAVVARKRGPAAPTAADSEAASGPSDPGDPGDPGDPDAPRVRAGDGEVRAFALRPALVLAAVITATILISRWVTDLVGERGTVGISALAGLADGHAGAVSAAALHAKHQVSVTVAAWAAVASIGANSLTKVVLAFVSGGAGFGRVFAAVMVPAMAAFAATMFLVG